MINLYSGESGGRIFFTGSNASTGVYTLGEGVNMYTTYNAATHQTANAVVKATATEGLAISDRQDAASYRKVYAILATVDEKLHLTECQVVYGSDAVFTTNPSLYKCSV